MVLFMVVKLYIATRFALLCVQLIKNIAPTQLHVILKCFFKWWPILQKYPAMSFLYRLHISNFYSPLLTTPHHPETVNKDTDNPTHLYIMIKSFNF